MGQKLKEGDIFFLPEKVFVMIGKYCIESGRVYDKAQDRSEIRHQLKSGITDALYQQELKFDPDIVERFVNFIAKDIPANTCRLAPGNFVVTHTEASGANDEKVLCHRVGDPSDRMHFNQNRTYGHDRFEALPINDQS